MRTGIAGILLGVAVVVTGCRHAAPPVTGRSSFRFVDPPAAPVSEGSTVETELIRQETYRDVRPILPLATPVYPPAALAAKVGLTTVGVHVTIGPDGRVTDVSPSLLAVSIPTKFDAEFQAAVRSALARWRFVPAETFKLETVPLPNGGSYWRRVADEKVEAAFDVAFTFTADGKVLGGP